MDFTPEQQKIIDARNCNILVSAAAGSGKTAVLVERIIRLITDENNPVDIDRFLVVTFTRAAASQMKDKIAKAINDRLDKEPGNLLLQRQSALIHAAQIMTIDSFCQYILRNSFSDIDIDPGFRIADEGEMKLLMNDTLQQLLEELYEEGNDSFLNMIDSLATGSDDKEVESIILDLYEKAMSNPWPDKWLSEHSNDYYVQPGTDKLNGLWYDDLCGGLILQIGTALSELKRALSLAELPAGPYMYGETLQREIEVIEAVYNWALEQKYIDLDQFASQFERIAFDRMPPCKDKSVDADIKNRTTALRDTVKKRISVIRATYFSRSLASHIDQMNRCDACLKELCCITIKFKERLDAIKKEKGLLSFADCEHLALNILVKHDDQKGYTFTDTARVYRTYYEYVMIDEYQDSNMIQELILSAVSGEEDGCYNRFMVGDIKQSIYRFRQADPSIFVNKYKEYSSDSLTHLRVDLHQNFRSRGQILNTTNAICSRLMSETVGDVDYDDVAALKLGAEYPDVEAEADTLTSELLIYDKDSSDIDKVELEAEGIATRISELVGAFQVKDNKSSSGLRKAEYRDIVILLRSPSTAAAAFKKALEARQIPAHIAGTEGYFSSVEIRTILHLLQIIQNPLQDIHFYGVLDSILCDFTQEEIAQIRILFLNGKPEGYKTEEGYLYEACNYVASLCETPEYMQYKELSYKITDFLDKLRMYRDMSEYMSVDKLIYQIVKDYDYRAKVFAMRGGQRRLANVDMLIKKAVDYGKTSYYGLYNFLRYIDTIRKFEIDDAEAETMDENADVVRIMSIHKSKGLEFPICFVSCLGKKFNLMDMRDSMVIDAHMGIGMKDVDLKRRVKSNTLRRVAICERMHIDTLSEELRVLYVALTRAMEHLILTCTVSSPQEAIEKCKDKVDGGITPDLVKSASGFSDWILMCLGSVQQDSDIDLKLQFFSQEDIKNTEIAERIDASLKHKELDDCIHDIENITIGNQKLSDLREYIEQLYTQKYPHSDLKGLYSKTSVSVLKHAAMPDDVVPEHILFDTPHDELTENTSRYVPRFISGNSDKPGATVRGSAFHRVMELINLSELYKADKKRRKELLIDQLNEYQIDGRLSSEQRRIMDNDAELQRILLFIDSDVGRRMAIAYEEGTLRKEEPFMIGITADLVDSSFPKEETVLIQGIIDAYWREENKYVILDYKTDRIKDATRLVELYKTQLDYYQKALEQMHMEVAEKLIYSYELNEVVLL